MIIFPNKKETRCQNIWQQSLCISNLHTTIIRIFRVSFYVILDAEENEHEFLKKHQVLYHVS